MLGFTIIKKKKLSELENDCKSLHTQLKKKITEVTNLKLELDDEKAIAGEFSRLNRLTILHSDSRKCEGCTLASDKCKKLIFADRTICVTPRNKANPFRKQRKPSKK